MRAWIEGIVEQIYDEAGFDTRVGACPLRLARALLGPGTVCTVDATAALPGDAALVRLRGESRIYVRSRLPVTRRNFAVLHELAEWHLEREDYQDEDREDVADALAAGLLIPRQLFLRALRDDGSKFPSLARRFATTESLVALRLGEVTGEPLALVAPRLRVRGKDWSWPPEEKLRQVARRRAPRGIRKMRLNDDRRRVALSPVSA